MAGILPTKNANNLKIYFNNSEKYAWPPAKPFKTRHSPQSQAREKSCGQRQLSSTRTTKPPRCQSSEPLVIPIKGEVMQWSGERSRSKGKNEWSIASKTRSPIQKKQSPCAWQSMMFRIGQPRGNRNVMASLPPPAEYYTGNVNLVQKFVLWISVNNYCWQQILVNKHVPQT